MLVRAVELNVGAEPALGLLSQPQHLGCLKIKRVEVTCACSDSCTLYFLSCAFHSRRDQYRFDYPARSCMENTVSSCLNS